MRLHLPSPSRTFRIRAICWMAASLALLANTAGIAHQGHSDAHLSSSNMPPELFSGLQYRMVGPSRGGRVTAVAGHRAQPSTFYFGASGGGVWKTNDSGITWTNVSDGYFASPSIGAIRVAESNPSIIYVGTGSDGLRSNVIIGKGVYRSDDGGETWTHIGLERVGNIGAVLIHPEDPELVYVAAIGNPFADNPERGVFRTSDGGRSWEKILFLSNTTGAVDLEFAPDNPHHIYAAMWRARRKPWTILSGGHDDGLYKSMDGGNSWVRLTQGLPQGLFGKADLAVTPADPSRVYALVEAPGESGGLYRSDDRGRSWCQITAFDKIRTRPFYYTNLEAHPSDPDTLWAMTEGYWKSSDAGQTWKRQPVPHGDNHDMWVNPDNPEIFIQANDGGANVTQNGGKTWSTQFNQPTAELYQVDVSDSFPYRLYAGQQDNTTISVPAYPPRRLPGGHTALWEDQGGCETGPAVPKPGDPDIVYANCKGRFGVFNLRTGQEMQHYVGFWNLYGHNPKDLAYRFQRVAPIHVSPHDPNRVYHCSQFVHVTDDGGKSWETISPDLTAFSPETQVISGSPITIDVTGEEHFSALYEIQESPHEEGVIWVGANDGPIHLTRDGGTSWANVTPPTLPPFGRVQTIEVSPHRPGKAYVSVLRYQLGDFSPYAFRTNDYGASWTRLTTGDNGVPSDEPVRVVREDPDREGLLYAGTEFGMYISFDDGEHWQSFQLNLPVTPVTDIKLVTGDLALSTMGRSFWILYDVSPLHELSAELTAYQAHLFPVRAAFRIYTRPGFRRSDLRSASPQYPSPGAAISYYLAADAGDDLRLEIIDSEGTVIRTFTAPSTAEREDLENEKGREGANSSRRKPPRLPWKAGMHRFVWDMRCESPIRRARNSAEEEQWRTLPGPMAPPGDYTARLSLGDWSQSRSVRLLLDPRAVSEGFTALEARRQSDFSLTVRDTISEAHRLAQVIESEIEKRAEATSLIPLRDRLVTAAVRYSQPKLIDQLEYLYSSQIGADQTPTTEAQKRLQELHMELSVIAQEANGVLCDPGGVGAVAR